VTRIYKILTATEWAAAKAEARYNGSAADLRDGFIHLSTAAQAAETARRHFSGQADLILLSLEAEALGASIRWEPSRGGALFPHLYAALDLASVLEARPLPLNAEGWPDPGRLEP
jgi:uncharacterized protein (DUF952 family)